jgi:hypothetical protein
MNAVYVSGGLLAVGALVAVIARALARLEARSDLESYMSYRDEQGIRALLACRRYLLSKDLEREAELWLIEREQEREERKERRAGKLHIVR